MTRITEADIKAAEKNILADCAQVIGESCVGEAERKEAWEEGQRSVRVVAECRRLRELIAKAPRQEADWLAAKESDDWFDAIEAEAEAIRAEKG